MSIHKKLQYPMMNLGHETQAWYDRHREIREAMGVQINPEIPKMWTPLWNSSTCHFVYSPIGNRTMENIAGNTRKISCQTSYTLRTYKIPVFKATGMENKDTQEDTYNDGTWSPGTTGCTRWNRMGQVHAWKYICIVAIIPRTVLSRNRKTELRIKLDICALIQKIWQMVWDQWEHRNAILDNSERLITKSEAAMIASPVQMELETGIQRPLQGDRYLFDDRWVAKSAKWTF
jgi:hypothetical protein